MFVLAFILVSYRHIQVGLKSESKTWSSSLLLCMLRTFQCIMVVIVIIKLRWSEEVWRITVLWVRNRATIDVTLKGLISVCGKVTIEGVIHRRALDSGFIIIWLIIAQARPALPAVTWSCWWSSWSTLFLGDPEGSLLIALLPGLKNQFEMKCRWKWQWQKVFSCFPAT